MDPRTNPYSPGAGTPPPELAGRNEVIEKASIAFSRLRAGRAARGSIHYGLRGVGKTVLLNTIRLTAEAAGIASVPIEAPEGRSLPSTLVPALRASLIQLSRGESIKAHVHAALKALKSFANAIKVKYADVEVFTDFETEPGVADSGELELDLRDLMLAVGRAAKSRGTALVLFIDELQYIPEPQMEALISALHRVNQEQVPVTMVAAGLPQLLGRMGEAKSYAERLFEFVPIDKLSSEAAREALFLPAQRENVSYTDGALSEVLRQTQGYPYFLQEWGKHCWAIASQSPITEDDAIAASKLALAELDNSFFRVRFDRLTPTEKRYMRAMASLGPGPHRSGDIAEKLGKEVTSVAPLRSSLIAKGMIYSPNHGDTAFTVPLFDGFMKRIMPA